MHHIIKSFFYAVTLLTLYWITQTPADTITFTAWVTAVQAVEAQQCAAILATIIEFIDVAVAGILCAPAAVVGGFRQAKKLRQ